MKGAQTSDLEGFTLDTSNDADFSKSLNLLLTRDSLAYVSPPQGDL